MKIHIPLFKFFKRQYFKIFSTDYMNGKFRVKYSDGRTSDKMSYWTAKSYADTFNGVVIDAF